MELATIQAITYSSNDVTAMSPDHIRASSRNDHSNTTLINTINQGFLTKHSFTEPKIHDFWEVQYQLSTERDLVLMDRRIVVPKSLKGKVLSCLYSAHQGIEGMKTRANNSVYWPGMNASIHNFRASCSTCAIITPSQLREPITMISSPGMAIPTNSDGHIPRRSHCVPCLCRQNNWLAHLVPPKTRLRHHIQIDDHQSEAFPNIWHPR